MSIRQLTDVSEEEIELLTAAVAAVGVDETTGEALHLLINEHGRRWIIESSLGQFAMVVDDPTDTPPPDGWLALSDRVRRFAQFFSSEAISLAVADDHTIVASAGSVSAAIDCLPGHPDEPAAWYFIPSALAVLSMRDFARTLMAIRAMPSGLDDERYPMPPMWMQLGGGELGLHVDWSDFLPSRGTYRIGANVQDGDALVAIPHAVIEAFLRLVSPVDDDGNEHEVTITVGTVALHGRAREAIALALGEWRLVLWAIQPLEERWAERIDSILKAAGIRITDNDGCEWTVTTDGSPVRVTLHHGHPDVARVSALVIDGAHESLDLLRELTTLNAASTGVRFWLEHGTVRAAADVRCTELDSLAAVVREVGAAAAGYAPMIATLATV